MVFCSDPRLLRESAFVAWHRLRPRTSDSLQLSGEHDHLSAGYVPVAVRIDGLLELNQVRCLLAHAWKYPVEHYY